MTQTTAVSPKITSTFIILEPTTLPIVISALPWVAAEILTAASGREVPIATIVRPMTSWGIPKRSAICDAPSTNQSAPFISITKPTTNKRTCNKISIFSLLFSFFFFPHLQIVDRKICVFPENSEGASALNEPGCFTGEFSTVTRPPKRERVRRKICKSVGKVNNSQRGEKEKKTSSTEVLKVLSFYVTQKCATTIFIGVC